MKARTTSSTVDAHGRGLEPRRGMVPRHDPPTLVLFLRGAKNFQRQRRGGKMMPSTGLACWQKVKVRYTRTGATGQWRSFGRYLERPGANPDRSGFTAGAEQVSLVAQCHQWERAGDQTLLRVMLSPEQPLDDYREFARQWMAAVERDLGTPLEWFAAIHRNTAHAHVHLGIRQNERLTDHYLQTMAQRRAREVATALAGYREAPDRAPARERAPDRMRMPGRGR